MLHFGSIFTFLEFIWIRESHTHSWHFCREEKVHGAETPNLYLLVQPGCAYSVDSQS